MSAGNKKAAPRSRKTRLAASGKTVSELATESKSARRTTRVRGFAPWRPRTESRRLIDTVLAVLEEYAAYLPLTIRQIFYRLVGVHNYDKTEAAYDRLGEKINRARRAGLIPFSAIRDDGITRKTPFSWESASSLVEAYIRMAEDFTLPRQEGQWRHLIFAVEAAGMVPLVEDVADPYGIEVVSSGGFDSVTAKYGLAQTLTRFEASEVLHIGDHDPSGVHVFSSAMEDVQAFAARDSDASIRFTRLAVTPAQMVELSLPTAPPKSTDRRSFAGQTTQVEAIPPDVLVEIVRSAITSRLNQVAYDAVLEQEEHIKEEFRRTLLPALRRIAPD